MRQMLQALCHHTATTPDFNALRTSTSYHFQASQLRISTLVLYWTKLISCPNLHIVLTLASKKVCLLRSSTCQQGFLRSLIYSTESIQSLCHKFVRGCLSGIHYNLCIRVRSSSRNTHRFWFGIGTFCWLRWISPRMFFVRYRSCSGNLLVGCCSWRGFCKHLLHSLGRKSISFWRRLGLLREATTFYYYYYIE